jgi:O-antigen/teichoic acid export membrane protein
MASVLSLWAIVNTLVLAFSIPLETIAPKLMHTDNASDNEIRLILHGLAISFGTVVLLVALGWFQIHSYMDSNVVVAIPFVISLGLWAGVRAVFVGRLYFKEFLAISTANSIVALSGLVGLYIFDINNSKLLLSTVTLGNFISVIIGMLVLAKRRSTTKRKRFPHFRFEGNVYQLSIALVLATGISLLMNNGGIAIAPLVGADPKFVISFAAMVSLVQIPMMLLNNISPVVNIRMTFLAKEGKFQEVSKLYYRILILFLTATLVIVIASYFLGRFGIKMFVGKEFELTKIVASLTALGVCIDWLTVMPRLLGVALGRAKQITYIWALGALFYSACFALPISGSNKLVWAPILGGLVVLFIGTLKIQRNPSTS